MAGNSQRRGAIRKPGSKKGPVAGTGGQKRKRLQAQGPDAQGRRSATGHPGRAQGVRPAARRSGASTSEPVRGGEALGVPAGKGADRERQQRGRRRAQHRRRGAAGRHPRHRAVRRQPDRLRRPGPRGAEARRGTAGCPLLEAPRARARPDERRGVHQGLALQVPPYEYAHPDDLLDAARDSGEPPLLVALDGVTDPRNLGAVVRSVAAFGGHGVVVPERRAAGMTAGAWKASAGAAARVPVARATNLTRALEA